MDGSDIHCALGQNAKLGIQRIARVLLDAEDWELDCDVEGRVGDVGLLVTQTHGPDEACTLLASPASVGRRLREALTFVFDRPSGEVGPDKGRLKLGLASSLQDLVAQ